MEPFASIMGVVYKGGAKKRWRTVCQNDRAPKQRHNQTSLSAWIRPPSWTKASLDLSEDVASLIVEALMREGVGNVQEIRAFALVNRTCASATAATLLSVCVQLRTLSSRVAQEEKRGRAYARRRITVGASDNNSDSDSSESYSEMDLVAVFCMMGGFAYITNFVAKECFEHIFRAEQGQQHWRP